MAAIPTNAEEWGFPPGTLKASAPYQTADGTWWFDLTFTPDGECDETDPSHVVEVKES